MDDPPIIFDNGSGYMKCGFVGDNQPKVIFPSTVGRPRHQGVMVGMGRKDAYVGDEALAKRGILRLKNPIEYGTVINWDNLEKIWHHSFYNELRCAPEEHYLFLTDKIPNSPKINREKMIQIAFETFNVPAFYIEYQSLLSLYATGKETAVIVDSGYNVTYSIPIYKHKIMHKAIQFTDIGGIHISQYMTNIVPKHLLFIETEIKPFCYTKILPLEDIILGNYLISGFVRNCTDLQCIGNDIRLSDDVLNLCYRFFDSREEFTLPDGKKISLSKYERNQGIEGIFDPLLLTNDKQRNEVSIQSLIRNTIQKCDAEYKSELSENIILCGGNTMFDSFAERLNKELNSSYNVQKWKSVVPQETDALNCSAWIGASILGSTSSFDEFWITKDQYDEIGPNIVERCNVFA